MIKLRHINSSEWKFNMTQIIPFLHTELSLKKINIWTINAWCWQWQETLIKKKKWKWNFQLLQSNNSRQIENNIINRTNRTNGMCWICLFLSFCSTTTHFLLFGNSATEWKDKNPFVLGLPWRVQGQPHSSLYPERTRLLCSASSASLPVPDQALS